MTGRSRRFPIGHRVTAEQLETTPYRVFDELREREPVSWLPAYGGWFITRRDLALTTMRDAETLTVDDSRFTTAAVLGDSMLSLDGDAHTAAREPYAPMFRPSAIRATVAEQLDSIAGDLVADLFANGPAELRTGFAGPMAVRSILEFFAIDGVTVDDVLGWYGAIGDAITGLTTGHDIGDDARAAVDAIAAHVHAAGLRADAVVVLFGAIETVEGMIANLLWHLLANQGALDRVRADRSLMDAAIDESLRLEPAASLVDRYATVDVEIGGAGVAAGDLVTINLLAANRDPAHFDRPHEFDLTRPNANQHVTFVHGPHACIGAHLARAETVAAMTALFDRLDATGHELRFDHARSAGPTGLIFRKPAALWVSSESPGLVE